MCCPALGPVDGVENQTLTVFTVRLLCDYCTFTACLLCVYRSTAQLAVCIAQQRKPSPRIQTYSLPQEPRLAAIPKKSRLTAATKNPNLQQSPRIQAPAYFHVSISSYLNTSLPPHLPTYLHPYLPIYPPGCLSFLLTHPPIPQLCVYMYTCA